ncbi:MAG TPA: NAD(P)/FAD-dependent oxidoreductase [Steroidobacteraceae bacterium]|jgi:L-2-hydroxyglutarate oxidase LhgO
MTESIDCAVIGAGVVGLAVARAQALAGREVIVLEAEGGIGTGVSSRNSEVIHAGIYYPTGSLKARLCVRGRELLYDFCGRNGVEHRRVGKLIVATSDEQIPTLAKYEKQATVNGVADLRRLTLDQVSQLEPAVRCAAALFSPSTGIVDSHALMLAYQADLEAHGGVLALNSPVSGGALRGGQVELEIGGASAMRLRAVTVINCAGLEAQAVSGRLRGVPACSVPTRYLAKGYYFSLSGRSPFHHLVYPVANAAGLGTHVTLDLNGGARFGPDVQWIEHLDFGVDESRRASFAEAIRLYYPELDAARLQPAYTGIRPKISAPGEPAADFCIRGPSQHDDNPYIALYGIESPGLTAALAIAEQVLGLVSDMARCS